MDPIHPEALILTAGCMGILSLGAIIGIFFFAWLVTTVDSTHLTDEIYVIQEPWIDVQ